MSPLSRRRCALMLMAIAAELAYADPVEAEFAGGFARTWAYAQVGDDIAEHSDSTVPLDDGWGLWSGAGVFGDPYTWADADAFLQGSIYSHQDDTYVHLRIVLEVEWNSDVMFGQGGEAIASADCNAKLRIHDPAYFEIDFSDLIAFLDENGDPVVGDRLEPGDYWLRGYFERGGSFPPGSQAADYWYRDWTLTLTPIPSPATALPLAVAALAMRRRTR